MQVSQLSPGDRFHEKSYGELELLKLTPCRALVRPTKRTARTIVANKGTPWEKSHTINTRDKAFSISLTTTVEVSS